LVDEELPSPGFDVPSFGGSIATSSNGRAEGPSRSLNDSS